MASNPDPNPNPNPNPNPHYRYEYSVAHVDRANVASYDYSAVRYLNKALTLALSLTPRLSLTLTLLRGALPHLA